jgi:hypothetical protein
MFTFFLISIPVLSLYAGLRYFILTKQIKKYEIHNVSTRDNPSLQ